MSFRHVHHESSSPINHTGALSVRYAGYQCLCTKVWLHDQSWAGRGVLLAMEGGIFIFFFPGVTSFYVRWRMMWLECAATICLWSNCWSQAGCVASSVGSWRWHYSNWLQGKPKIGPAKSSINKTCQAVLLNCYSSSFIHRHAAWAQRWQSSMYREQNTYRQWISGQCHMVKTATQQ